MIDGSRRRQGYDDSRCLVMTTTHFISRRLVFVRFIDSFFRILLIDNNLYEFFNVLSPRMHDDVLLRRQSLSVCCVF